MQANKLWKNSDDQNMQYAYFDVYQSEKRLVSCGVPQGSVFEPILCLIYNNDLPNKVFSSLALLFTDDPIHCSINDSLRQSAS